MTLALPYMELLTSIAAFLFTVALLSYLLGDNPLYRLAIHILVGVAVGYIALVVIYQVLTPRLIVPLASGEVRRMALASVPLVLFIFLVLKLSPRTAAWGNISTAYLIGVGTAVAVGGAVTGTLLPLVQATWLSLLPEWSGNFINHGVVVVGVVTTLLYFQFWMRGRATGKEGQRAAPMRLLAGIGQFFLVVALATVYGGMILSGIAALSERLTAMLGWVTSLLR